MRKFLATMLLAGMSAVLVHAQGDAAKLEGAWMLTGIGGDKELGKEFFDKVMAKLILKNGDYEQFSEGMKIESGKYKIDPAKTPATIDLDIRDGDDKGKTQLGIFKIEGDKLTIAMGKSGSGARPKTFEAKEGGDQVMFFTRSK